MANIATFQPNPNYVYQTEHLFYFKFVGRVVARAPSDGQLLDVYFTRSCYKHILGVKVTYHDIEATDPDYYKNLKRMLKNDVNDIPDLTFSMDADEEKHIFYEEKKQRLLIMSLNLEEDSWKPLSEECMDWLETKPSQSVVYISFGGMVSLIEERWKSRHYLQQRARKERLSNSRKLKGE